MEWKKYPEEKPEKSDWYFVTIRDWFKNLFVDVNLYIADGDNVFERYSNIK